MTNPYQQQHGSSNFPGGDSLASSGLPPLNLRRASYASIVSGAPSSAMTRPTRAGFSHLLNPSPGSEQQHHASNLYSSALNARIDSSMTNATRNGARGEDLATTHSNGGGTGGSTGWASSTSRLPGSNLQWFSRAFDLYMSRNPSLTPAGPIGPDDFGFAAGAAHHVSNISGTGFLSPSYLRGSVYLKKLEEKHRAKMLAEREGHAVKGQQVASSSSSGSAPAPTARLASNGSSHLPAVANKVSGGSHRGVSYDVVEKPMYPLDDDNVSPLPSRWNKEDKEAALEVLDDGYQVKYTGRVGSDIEASAVRADNHMSASCGVYYFEIVVLNRKKEDTPIAIGFSSKTASLSRAPGWEPESWGYHGDDGHCFAAQNVGKPYGPRFGTGDTVGCLVNFRLGQAMFTLNGKELGIAFRDINFKDVKGKLYPIVGLKKKDDHIWANFGQVRFMFDIDGYMKRQQDMIEAEIRQADPSKLVPGLSETELIQQLVLQFLQHDGYVETARAFAEELHAEKTALRLSSEQPVKGISIKDDEDANNRQRIRQAILEGDIDRAIDYTKTHYPNVLRNNEQVYFRLRCRKFIEMIRKEAELNMLLEERKIAKRRSHLHHLHGQRGEQQGQDDEEMLDTTTAAPTSTAASVRDNWEDDMDVYMTTSAIAGEEEEDYDDGGEEAGSVSKLSQDALTYGMELRAEFKSDARGETSKHLDEIFSLIAYPNPLKVKEVAHLLGGEGRVAVAEELNAAILTSLGKSSRAALENVYAQTCVLLEDLRKDGGDGAFVTVQSLVEGIPPARLL
ncbi:CTLH/CRA C-terminal to lish motif domain-containing protein [Madurella fahalii]|uniref:CTLH/CRA C-terminal to lish motif domain-containing protein n=1 Tax=Madurella fahalii TaxID=1157608 RepID=A0ABQ0G816_9PEZI